MLVRFHVRLSRVACASSVHNREVYQVHTSSVASSTFWHAKKLSTQYQTTISQKGFFKSTHLYWKTLSWFVGTSSETIHETDDCMTIVAHCRSFCGRQPPSSSFPSVGPFTSCGLWCLSLPRPTHLRLLQGALLTRAPLNPKVARGGCVSASLPEALSVGTRRGLSSKDWIFCGVKMF